MASASVHPRLHAARAVFGLAAVLLIAMLFMKVGKDVRLFESLPYVSAFLLDGFMNKSAAGLVAIIASVACPQLLLPLHPFLAGFYMRARPIFWMLLLFSIPGLVYTVLMIGYSLAGTLSEWAQMDPGILPMVILSMIIPGLHVAGILLIPTPRTLLRWQRRRSVLPPEA